MSAPEDPVEREYVCGDCGTALTEEHVVYMGEQCLACHLAEQLPPLQGQIT